MRSTSLIFAAVGAATGLGLAVLGFQVSSAAPTGQTDDSGRDLPAVGRPLQAAPPQVTHRWAPCAKPAHLVRGACVTVVHRTVTVYDAPPPVAPPAAAPPVAVPVTPAAAAPAPVPRRHRSSGSASGTQPADDHPASEPDDGQPDDD